MDLKTKETVTEMIAVIGVYTLILEFIGILLFGGFQFDIAVGFLAGGIAASFMVVQMANSLSLSMDLMVEDSKKQMIVGYLKRWGAVLLLFLFSYFTGILHILAVLAGVFGLKAGAYGQPAMHKLFKRLKG